MQEEMAWEEQEKSKILAPALNVSQLPSNNGMVVASGLRSPLSSVQLAPANLAPSPAPELVIIPATPQLAPPPSDPQPSSPPQQPLPVIQPPTSGEMGEIEGSPSGHALAPVESKFKEPIHPAHPDIPRSDETPAPCPRNATGIVAVEVPLDDAVPEQLASGQISEEPMPPSGQESAPETLSLQMPPSPS